MHKNKNKNLKKKFSHKDERKTYLKKVMDAGTFKLLHWHVITLIHLTISDDSFERSPCITLVQNQIWRTIRGLRQARLARSFGWRERIALNGMDCLDGLHIHQRFVQVHCWRYKLGNLGKESLTWLLLLGASTSWEVVQVHSTRYWLRLPLPNLDGSHLDQWGCCNIVVPTGHCFLFILPHCSYPYNEENQFKKKKKREREKKRWKWNKVDNTYFDK